MQKLQRIVGEPWGDPHTPQAVRKDRLFGLSFSGNQNPGIVTRTALERAIVLQTGV